MPHSSVANVNSVAGHGGELVNVFHPFIAGVDDYFHSLAQFFRLYCRRLRFFSDNQSVVRIVHCGSSIFLLQQIAMDIFRVSE